MKLHLTRAQLRDAWRLRAFPQPMAHDGCSIVRFDGIDLDSWLDARMDDWYQRLLDEAPVERLAPVDVSPDLDPQFRPDGSVHFDLPQGFRRLVELRLEGWAAPARIVTDLSSPLARMQSSPFARGGPAAPVAVVTPGGIDAYSVTLGAASTPAVTSALMIIDTPDDTFHIDSSALSDIKPLFTV